MHRYRVGFNFWSIHGVFYTEWFDTREEAVAFMHRAKNHVHVIRIEDETGEVV